jgi:hypothetical protein
MVGLDQSLRSVFDTLQQSIYSYQNSLNQGLNQMHTLGQQGELMFSALVNHLGQQINQETLAYLESGQRRELPQPQAEPSAPETLAGNTFAAGEAALSPELEDDLALEALDLDIDFDDDDITLLQIEDDITELQLDETLEGDLTDDAIASPLDLQLLDSLDAAAPDPSPAVSLPERESDLRAEVAAAGVEAESALDDLYQSLFGGGFFATGPGAEAAEAELPGLADIAFEDTGFEEVDAAIDDFLESARPEAAIADALFQSDETQSEGTQNDETDFSEQLTLTEDLLPRPEDLALLTQATDSAEADLGTDPDGDRLDDLDDLFGSAPADSLEASLAGSLAIPEAELPETIASFDELLPAGPGETGDLEPITDDGEDRLGGFMAASPEEDLLAQDELPVTTTYDLTMDEAMVDQLQQDLEHLETTAAEPILPGFLEPSAQPDDAVPSTQDDLDISFLELEGNVPSQTSDRPSEAAAPDLSTLDLFGSEPAPDRSSDLDLSNLSLDLPELSPDPPDLSLELPDLSSDLPDLAEELAGFEAEASSSADPVPDFSNDLFGEPALNQPPASDELDLAELSALAEDNWATVSGSEVSDPAVSGPSLGNDLASVNLFGDVAPAVDATPEVPSFDLFSDDAALDEPAPDLELDLFDIASTADPAEPTEELSSLALFDDVTASPENTDVTDVDESALDLFSAPELPQSGSGAIPGSESASPDLSALDLFDASDRTEPAVPDDAAIDLFSEPGDEPASVPPAADETSGADLSRVDLFGDPSPRAATPEDLFSTLEPEPSAQRPSYRRWPLSCQTLI